MGKKPSRETNATLLRQAILRRLPRRVSARGEITIPAVPSLLDHFQQMLLTTFSQAGRVFNEEETKHLRKVLETWLNKGWEISPHARLVVHYETDAPPKTTLSYNVALSPVTIGDEYDHWVKTRTPPLFGAHPDAKVMLLARSLGEPSEVPVLDVGAGTGRNTLPLAREGFPTDAVELAPALAKILREDIEKEGLKVRVFEGDVVEPALGVPPAHYRLIFLAEVVASHFRDMAHIRRLFEALHGMTAPDGVVLLSTFLGLEGYKPDPIAREMGQVLWCSLFTRGEFEQATKGLFVRVQDESTVDFERENLAPEAWPPTGWFEQWSSGRDLFDLPPNRPPVELRWMTYRKQG